MDNLILFLVLITVGYISGKTIESRHFRSIEAREREFLQLPAVTLKDVGDNREVFDIRLVAGNAVISVDYFKRFLAQLRNIVGGQVSSYETLIDRARREAILRMKDECKDADIILNMRLETSSISKGGRKNTIGSIEALAYGTAITYVPGSVRKPLPPPEPAAKLQQPVKKTRPAKPVAKTDKPVVGQSVKKPLPQKPVSRAAKPVVGTTVKSPPQKAAAPQDALYRIVFSGELAEGQTPDAVKKRIAALFKMSPAKCDKLFAGPSVIKDNADARTAKQYKQAFERTGAICRIERIGKKSDSKK